MLLQDLVDLLSWRDVIALLESKLETNLFELKSSSRQENEELTNKKIKPGDLKNLIKE